MSRLSRCPDFPNHFMSFETSTKCVWIMQVSLFSSVRIRFHSTRKISNKLIYPLNHSYHHLFESLNITTAFRIGLLYLTLK